MKRERHTILLVDDDPNDLLFIGRAFREGGIADPICTASNADEAICYLHGLGKFADRCKFEFPSFIMCDLKMGPGDGFKLLRELKGNPTWAIIPTVIFSDSCDEDDIKKAYLLGANSFLIKPQHPDRLRELIKKFHDYWTTVEVPRTNAAGEMLSTESHGKLGAAFSFH